MFSTVKVLVNAKVQTLYKCGLCNKSFLKSNLVLEHFLTHLNRKNCASCGNLMVKIGNKWFSEHDEGSCKPRCEELEMEYVTEDGDDIQCIVLSQEDILLDIPQKESPKIQEEQKLKCCYCDEMLIERSMLKHINGKHGNLYRLDLKAAGDYPNKKLCDFCKRPNCLKVKLEIQKKEKKLRIQLNLEKDDGEDSSEETHRRPTEDDNHAKPPIDPTIPEKYSSPNCSVDLYECHLCNYTDKSKLFYLLHLFEKHGYEKDVFNALSWKDLDALNPTHVCSVCGMQKMKSAFDFYQHNYRLHNDIYQHMRMVQMNLIKYCKICEKLYLFYDEERHTSAEHKRKSGEKGKSELNEEPKPHECDVCSKSFDTQEDLKKHRVSHTTKPKFQCELCKSAYAESAALKRHILTEHSKNRFLCTVCKKRFPNATNLKQHMKKDHKNYRSK